MAAVEIGVANGNGLTNGSRPRTPSLNTLSLTEYSTNPSPPSASPRSKIRGLIPDEFILPNGYPDVFNLSSLENDTNQTNCTHSISALSSPPASTKSSKKHPSPTPQTSATDSNAKSS
jgi:hypothetical protein